MKLKFTFLLLFALVSLSACGQKENVQENEEKALQVAKTFMEAIYHGEYEKAKKYAFNFSYEDLISNISYDIDNFCIKQKQCVPVDPDWEFNLLKTKYKPLPMEDGTYWPEYGFYFQCSEESYSDLWVTLDDDGSFKVSLALVYAESACHSHDKISEL